MRIERAKTRLPTTKKDIDSENNQRVSSYTESYKGEYYNIELTKLIPFRNQSRKHFNLQSLEELASSIKAHGIRQPLTILPSIQEEGKYEIISGERRWRAAKIAGLSRAPCIIIHDAAAAEEIALIENIQRQDLHPLELMSAFQNLLDKKICKSTQEIALKLGINKSTVVETLSLSNLPNTTQEALLKEGIKVRKVLRELVKNPQESHSKIITNYKNSIIKKENKEDTTIPEKILSVYIQDGLVTFQDNKITSLSDIQKKEVQESLSRLLQSADRK
jgi:ParB family chromosome partitioning protein